LLALLAAAVAASPAFAALKVGDKAPDFTAPSFLAGKQSSFHLADALKQGPVVVYFFPAAHTGGCNLEAHLFSQAIDKFKAEGATVIGVTAGHTSELAAFSSETEHCSGKFAVASDEGAKIAKQYDAILAMKPSWSDRVSYVVAQDGTIATVHSDMNPNGHVEAMLSAVAALKSKGASVGSPKKG
jgi:peroxiredoxin